MPDGSVPLIVAIIILVLLSAFFSSTETAYSCANKVRLRALSTEGNKRAERTLLLAEEKFDRLISTVLVGNNIVNLTCATLSTLLFAKIITNGIDSSLVSTIVITVAVLIFGEITPKFFAKAYPEKMAMAYYPLIVCFYYILYPFNFIFSGWKWLIAKVFRIKDNTVVTEEEIMTIVEEAEEDGTLKKDETKLIRSVIEFDDLEVGDILVPRVNMVAIDIDSNMEDILKVYKEEEYSRLPVYKDSIDQIIGTIHGKDFYLAYLSGKKDIKGILQDVYYTTEHIKISNLLKQLQKNSIHIAIVLDEYGGTLGLVTLEDILEELVGEIYDEFDEVVDFFKNVGMNEYFVDCNAPLVDMFEKFNLETDEEQFDATTVSGFIIEYLGEIPKINKKFSYKNLDFEVLKSTVKKVQQVKVTVNEIQQEE